MITPKPEKITPGIAEKWRDELSAPALAGFMKLIEYGKTWRAP